MSLKNSTTVSDYLEFDSTLNKANKILKGEKNYKIAFLVIVGINVGLRISDLRKLRFEDLVQNNITIIEKKTNKKRTIQFNENVLSAFTIFKQRCQETTGNLFLSNRKTIFSTQYINMELKKIFGKANLNISSHSLRKAFGRRVWDNHNQSNTALIYLTEIFNHTNIAVTRRYLGIRQEELNNIYLNL